MKTAIYSRLASADAELIEQKESEMLNYAESNGFTPCVCYRDNGQSGVQLDRPGLQNLLSNIRSGGIERVIVADIARLSRGYIQTNELLRMFADHGVEFISVKDGFSPVMFDEYLSLATGLEKFIQSQRRIRQSV
jgi:DNA invertase Pin-like site-specific DNA recombinase